MVDRKFIAGLCFILCLSGASLSAQYATMPIPVEHKPLSYLFKIQTKLMQTQEGVMPDTFNGLSFFCRIESLIEKQSNIAFRFRLGNLDYVNSLECKK